jgi:hypothetical protein
MLRIDQESIDKAVQLARAVSDRTEWQLTEFGYKASLNELALAVVELADVLQRHLMATKED